MIWGILPFSGERYLIDLWRSRVVVVSARIAEREERRCNELGHVSSLPPLTLFNESALLGTALLIEEWRWSWLSVYSAFLSRAWDELCTRGLALCPYLPSDGAPQIQPYRRAGQTTSRGMGLER